MLHTQRLSYVVYLSIIVCNIVKINSAMLNDNEFEMLPLSIKDGALLAYDGSGMTELTSEMPTTVVQTINLDTTSPTTLSTSTIATTPILRDAIKIIRNDSKDSDEKADALISYLQSSDNLTTIPNLSDTLTPREIDELIDGLSDIQTKNRSGFLLVSQSTSNGIIGVLSQGNLSKEIIQNTSKIIVDNAKVSAAIFINDQSINIINNIKALIIDEPTAYRKLNPSDKQDLVSSVIIAGINSKVEQPIIYSSLFFKVLHDDHSKERGRYSCAFLDTDTATWNETGCSKPVYNKAFDRYECTCNHLTTYALIWLPDIVLSNELTSQDIVSLVFQSISILCFIAVIIHSLYIRFRDPLMSLQARDLLPLISSASTTIVLIVYIALSITVYTRISSPSSPETSIPCFTSASVLMFLFYFFLIFMFCVKTSVGYFNYLRFVHLFPEPSYRKLFLLLLISFFIAITCTSLAVGLNSNPSFHITQLHQNKLCWFTRDVLYYFMLIPVGVFLLFNAITISFVAKHIIRHARNATSPHQSYERMKRCVLVLLSSCVTQGIGWLFGPLITIPNSTSIVVFAWLFVVFNGLEGLWTILLYIVIRSQRMDESKRVVAARELRKKTPIVPKKSEREWKFDRLNRISEQSYGDKRTKNMAFNDLYEEESINWVTSIYEL